MLSHGQNWDGHHETCFSPQAVHLRQACAAPPPTGSLQGGPGSGRFHQSMGEPPLRKDTMRLNIYIDIQYAIVSIHITNILISGVGQLDTVWGADMGCLTLKLH
jgi:hypothetical protein